MSKEWKAIPTSPSYLDGIQSKFDIRDAKGEPIAYAFEADEAAMLAAAPEMHSEMMRYLPILERAEADPEVWSKLTAGLGIATANAFRYAAYKAVIE